MAVLETKINFLIGENLPAWESNRLIREIETSPRPLPGVLLQPSWGMQIHIIALLIFIVLCIVVFLIYMLMFLPITCPNIWAKALIIFDFVYIIVVTTILALVLRGLFRSLRPQARRVMRSIAGLEEIVG